MSDNKQQSTDSSKVLYPECEKLLEEGNIHRAINDFIEFLYENGYYIKHSERSSLANRDTLVYDFMDVDAVKLEKERRQMLSNINQVTNK